MTQPTSEALSEGRMAAIRKHLESPGVPEFSCTMVSHNELSALFATLDQALARCEAAERRAQLDPTENMVLTIALAQIERGDDVPPNTTAALVFALARIAGREGFDAAQPEPDTGGVG